MDLASLARRADPASRDTYVSVYADLGDAHAERALLARVREARAALPEELRANLDEAWAGAERALKGLRGRGARGAAVFASPAHGFAEEHALAEPVPTALVVDSSPYLRPLARFLDAHEAFTLVLLDGRRAAVYAVDAGLPELLGQHRTRLLGRHTKGGWSQRRYQRNRQGALDRYLDEVADRAVRAMQESGAPRVVVAGPGHVKKQFLARAPVALRDALLAVEDVDFDHPGEAGGELLRRFVALARAEEAKDSEEALAAFKGELLRGELALAGPFESARAARDGRVAKLLVRKGHQAGGRKCEAHQALFPGDARCPVGGEPGTQVDLLNEALEWTAQHEGEVEFVADGEGFLRELGGAGALLRW